ncbi:fungal-specific transcription factor domain-containing protein [Immersiella caudata]|uniref:Fungal-specific transcription factor domain-containing protein n=1 Tax=Immersiella caudata TaxID=314043 RepID=A0AA39XEQ7_9PEZI|nr:fungal-specific transcription factor domain-containing protein [Immersiella caudata]
MEHEQPAGYFSTFSIVDPDGSTREGHGRTQRRNRRVFVCIPCHRRKLKCDKAQPCSRCVASGAPSECVYQQAPSQKPESGGEPDTASRHETHSTRQPSPEPSRPGPRVYGATHWRSIAREVEAWPYIEGSDPQWHPRYQQLLGLEGLFPSLPSTNFPFGNAFTFSQSRSQVLENLPPPQVVNALIQSYFGTFESTHRLVHKQEFSDELNAFWINSDQLSEQWLAQFCMMLALGCQASPSRILASTGRTAEDWTDTLLDAAQFFLKNSSYFSNPSLTTIRTLCLSVIARMMEIVKGGEMTHLVFLMGFVVRMAMTVQLHRKSSLFTDISPFEAEMRKRIWVTVQLLDLDIAMRTGTSYLYREFDADPPLDINDSDFQRSEHGWIVHPRWAASGGLTDSTFQVKLASLIPAMTEIINTVNSPTRPPIEHEKVRVWDSRLRQKLQDAESVLSLPPFGQNMPPDKAKTQVHFLRVLVHRTLLALHYDYICAVRAGQFRDSTISVMQSSVALLRTHNIWHAPSRSMSASAATSGASGAQPRGSTSSATGLFDPLEQSISPLSWLSDLCHDDFGAAMQHLMLTLRRGDFDNVKGGALPSRSGASAILQQSLEYKRVRACRSIPHFQEYVGLSVSASCLRSLNAGEPILPSLLEVASQIEQTVLQSRQDLLWTQTNNPFSGQAGLPPDPFVFGFGQ